MAFFAGKIAEQDVLREAAKSANNPEGVEAATAEIENYKKRLLAVLKIQKWVVDPARFPIKPTQKKFLDEADKKSSEIQMAEDLLKKLIEEGQGRSAAASSLWRKIKFNAEELKESLLSAIDDFSRTQIEPMEDKPDSDGTLGGTTSNGGISIPSTLNGGSGTPLVTSVGVQGAGSGVAPIVTRPVSISGTGSFIPAPSVDPTSQDSVGGDGGNGGQNDVNSGPKLDALLRRNYDGLGVDLKGCVDQFGLDEAYPCAIRQGTPECKRTTCSNQQMEQEFKRLRDYFVAKKESEMASCMRSHFLKKAKVYGLTRDQVAKKIKALKVRISRAKATAQTAKALKLQAELRKYQFRYNSKDYFKTSGCKTLARHLQCKLAAIWSVQDRLSYRTRKPDLVKKELFGKLPAAQQNACFDRVILGRELGAASESSPRGYGLDASVGGGPGGPDTAAEGVE